MIKEETNKTDNEKLFFKTFFKTFFKAFYKGDPYIFKIDFAFKSDTANDHFINSFKGSY